MATDQIRRKLAAILAADVVGYSRFTGADEEATVARLRALRQELIDPVIAVNRGRGVKAHRVRQRRRCLRGRGSKKDSVA